MSNEPKIQAEGDLKVWFEAKGKYEPVPASLSEAFWLQPGRYADQSDAESNERTKPT